MVARQAEFDALMEKCPENEALRGSLTELWTKPPLGAIRHVVPSCESEDEARRLLFFPTASDGGAYCRMIAPKAAGYSGPSPARPALGLMFMMHHGSSGFYRRFVLAGGLDHLALRLTEGDLHVRAHAVEVFLRITGDEGLRWYMTPEAGSEDAALQAALLSMDRDRGVFFQGLVANRRDSFPGGEKSCLDLLAFWLGWARQQHCESMRMSLSQNLLVALSDWVPCAKDRGDADEVALAQQLFDDFSRMPPHNLGNEEVGGVALITSGDDDDEACGDEPVVVELAEGGFDLDARASAPLPPPPPEAPKVLPPKAPPKAKTHRVVGNEKFASGDFEGALDAYELALADLKVGFNDDESISVGSAINLNAVAVLLCNRATCLYKLSERDDASKARWLRRSEVECGAAVAADPKNVKAHYRLAQTLQASGDDRIWDAINATKRAKECLPKGPSPQRTAVEDLLLSLMNSEAASNLSTTAEATRDAVRAGKTSRIMQSLLRARDGSSSHEMMGKWSKAKADKAKAAQATADEARVASNVAAENETPTLSSGLDGTGVPEAKDDDDDDDDDRDSDEDRESTAIVDAAADSDDDDMMVVRQQEKELKKQQKKAKLEEKAKKAAAKAQSKENVKGDKKKKPKAADDAAKAKKKKADKIAKILAKSMS